MRRWITVLLLLAVAGAAAWLWARSQASPWTADSEPALAEFRAGREAAMKFYYPEAVEHLRRAVELDPEFIAPKIFLVRYTDDKDLREELIRQLRQTDTARLSERERFLLGQCLGRIDGETEQQDEALQKYLENHPEDPFALSMAADRAWVGQEWERASALYRRLLEVDPNWVEAQNRLGYIAMAQGRFAEAEELFATYAYIAPDQPNPHDSMAELLTLIGRYDEARKELEKALAIRPSFCASYRHLLTVELLDGRRRAAARVVERSGEQCEEKLHLHLTCLVEAWTATWGRDPAAVWGAIPAECRPGVGSDMDAGEAMRRAALAAGQSKIFDHLLKRIEGYKQEASGATMQKETIRGVLHHLRGLRAAVEGDLRRARDELETADGALVFWGDSIGLLKLLNLADLARVEEQLGNTAEAATARQRIREINPLFLEGNVDAPLFEVWP